MYLQSYFSCFEVSFLYSKFIRNILRKTKLSVHTYIAWILHLHINILNIYFVFFQIHNVQVTTNELIISLIKKMVIYLIIL